MHRECAHSSEAQRSKSTWGEERLKANRKMRKEILKELIGHKKWAMTVEKIETFFSFFQKNFFLVGEEWERWFLSSEDVWRWFGSDVLLLLRFSSSFSTPSTFVPVGFLPFLSFWFVVIFFSFFFFSLIEWEKLSFTTESTIPKTLFPAFYSDISVLPQHFRREKKKQFSILIVISMLISCWLIVCNLQHIIIILYRRFSSGSLVLAAIEIYTCTLIAPCWLALVLSLSLYFFLPLSVSRPLLPSLLLSLSHLGRQCDFPTDMILLSSFNFSVVRIVFLWSYKSKLSNYRNLKRAHGWVEQKKNNVTKVQIKWKRQQQQQIYEKVFICTYL